MWTNILYYSITRYSIRIEENSHKDSSDRCKKRLHCLFTSFRWIVNMVIDLFSFINGKHIMYVQTDEPLFSVQKTRYTFLHTKWVKVYARAAATDLI